MARPKATIEPSKLVSAFAARGLHGISSEQLARLAGVSKPTLYAHGHTKESLFLLTVESEVERLLERLHCAEQLTRGRTARDRAKGTAHAILNHGAARPDGLRLLARITLDQLSTTTTTTTVAAAVDRIPERITVALKRDLTADRLDATLAPSLARAIWGAAIMLATTPSGERRPNRERLAAIAASVVPPRPSLPPEHWPPAT
jgi:AcrR family transcriptional regulator